MHLDPITLALFLLFASAAIVATLVLYTRQSLLVAYIFLGALLGPYAMGWFSDTVFISQIGNLGIMFLLFLVGLHLQLKSLTKMLSKASFVTLLSSLAFALIGFTIGKIFHFDGHDSLIIGCAMMFSSTIIGLKLLPTTILHHQHTGDIMISVLLIQDLIAIFALLILNSARDNSVFVNQIGVMFLSLPLLIVIAFWGANYLLLKLMRRFDRVQEYIFLMSISWCLTMAVISSLLHLSAEIGAFIAGVSLATHPVAQFIAESLKPLRDFFLILFFFSIGAEFNFTLLPSIALPALCLTAAVMFCKPAIFRGLLQLTGETKQLASEVGMRLAQGSEFSFLITAFAISEIEGQHLLTNKAAALINTTVVATFIISSYLIVMRYPTPMGVSERLRRD